MKTCLAATLLAAVALSGSAAAQCSDNVYPVVLVDALGVPLPTVFEEGHDYYQFNDDQVYMALDPATPSGTYIYQVSDTLILNLLSQDLLVDREIQVVNNAGVIDLTRVSGNPALPAFGVGLNGVGESIPLFPFTAPPAGSPTCRFKAWLSDYYLYDRATQPYGSVFGPQGGINPNTGECAIRSFAFFKVGDGSGASASGTAFDDLNENGVRDPGEPGLPGLEVCLDDGATSTCTTTDASGNYSFSAVPCGTYTVQLNIDPASGYHATTQTSFDVEICGCGDVAIDDFGLALDAPVTCNGKTPGFWRNKNGKEIIDAGNYLSYLPSLHVVDANGNPFSTGSFAVYKQWMQDASAVNMAYMLSIHLVAMKFNVLSGGVSEDCMVDGGSLGDISIGDLIDQAIDALIEDGYTPVGDPNRAEQEALKNALDNANNNLNWI